MFGQVNPQICQNKCWMTGANFQAWIFIHFFPPFQEAQVRVVKLISQCQQSVVHTYPIPFGRADCRQALYHVLLCCLLTDLPNVPSPVNHAVRLFSYGLQDADLAVKGVRVI